MTYFAFLILFLGFPIFILAGLGLLDWRSGKSIPEQLVHFSFGITLLIHALVALIYTTPWDNYLVATGVWTYDPNLVMGILIGYVPIEEYLFFIIQPILVGLWYLYLSSRMIFPNEAFVESKFIRLFPAVVITIIWFIAGYWLIFGEESGTYIGLILLWSIPPIVLQFVFGGDILWKYKKLAVGVQLSATIYLSLADSLAIFSGTWSIDPLQSTNILFGGVLPLEEFVFFLVTCTLISYGITLFLAAESHSRAHALFAKYFR